MRCVGTGTRSKQILVIKAQVGGSRSTRVVAPRVQQKEAAHHALRYITF